MQVSEAIKRWGNVLGQEIEVEGVAEISNAMSVIYQDRVKRNIDDPLTPSILIHGDCLRSLVDSLPNRIAGYGGSEVLYVLNVRITGIVANTGYRFAPLKFAHIYEIEFEDELTGKQKILVNHRLKDISIKVSRTLTATEVKQFEPYFPDFKNLVELKHYLESGQEVFLIKRILENQLTEHLNWLNQLKIPYYLYKSPIENGFFGMP